MASDQRVGAKWDLAIDGALFALLSAPSIRNPGDFQGICSNNFHQQRVCLHFLASLA